ncbi:MAG: hypothetical protein ACM3Q2_16915 [Syntrophothermus sp.]
MEIQWEIAEVGRKSLIRSFPGTKSFIYFTFVLTALLTQKTNAQPERFSFKPEIPAPAAFSNLPDFISFKIYPDTSIAQDTSEVSGDTTGFPVETKPQLLPDKISFMEKFLWGENGFFRKTGITSPLAPESRKNELQARRTMLTAHQIGGFTTLGLMLASCYYGQKIIDGHNNFRGTHQAFVTATIASYSITGLLSVLSPPPLIRRDEESTTSIHKTLAWVHFAGMIATPILGNMIGGRRNFNIDRAHVHQIAAYATTVVFTAAMVVMTF